MADAPSIEVVAVLDLVGVRNDPAKGIPAEYHARGDTFMVTQAEYDRLTSDKLDAPAVRKTSEDAAPADTAPVVTTPNGSPTDQPSDPSTPHPTAFVPDGAAAPVDADAVGDGLGAGSNAAQLYSGFTAAQLADVAGRLDPAVDVPSSATKSDLARALDERGVTVEQANQLLSE